MPIIEFLADVKEIPVFILVLSGAVCCLIGAVINDIWNGRFK